MFLFAHRRGAALLVLPLLSFALILGFIGTDTPRLARFAPSSAPRVPDFNDGIQKQLLAPLPTDMTMDTKGYLNYKAYTEHKLRELTACSARGDCHPNAGKIVIFSSVWCKMAFYAHYGGGEGVWCHGVQRSLVRQGFTVLHAGSGDWPYIAHLHRQLGGMVKAIFADTERTEYGPINDFYGGNGFPAWKVFAFSYWAQGMPHPIGRPWTVLGEPSRDVASNYTYLGYDLEPYAEDTEFIPLEERPMRIFILAKRVQYFYPSWAPALFSHDIIRRALIELRKEFPALDFVGSFVDDRNEEQKAKFGDMEVPEGVKNLGPLNAVQFDEALARSRMVLGIGWPTTSPSPYRALARGTPFVNPHTLHDHGRDDGPLSWKMAQHESMRDTPEPMVYNVRAQDYDGLLRAIRISLTTEMKPYRFERMEPDVVDRRLSDFVNADWRGLAQRILEERKAGNETQEGPGLGLFEL